MIGIYTYHPDEVFLEHLNLPFQLIKAGFPKIDGLFIDWRPQDKGYEEWQYQASLVENYIKKIPIVIFDRHFSLQLEEVAYLKNNAFLFEPALNTNRKGFGYLPIWISYYSVLDTDNRPYDVIDISNEVEYKIESFDKYYKEYARLFPDKKVAYYTKEIRNFKKEEYEKNNLISIEGKVLPDYTISNFTVVTSQRNAYEIGYFDPVYFIAMNQGCVPLLPEEHRFFHSIFKNLIISNIQDMDYYVSLYKTRSVIIEEIFDRFKKFFPEFTVEYASDVIRRCLNE